MLKPQTIENICKDTIVAHRSSFTNLKERWDEMLNRYENKLRVDSISADTESKIALGGAFALVENTLPRIFARQPKYKYLGRESGDTDGAELYQEFSEYQWDEADAKKKIEKIARWGLVCGLAGWKMGWKEESVVTKKNGKEILGLKTSNPIIMGLMDKIGVGKNVKIDETSTVANYTLLPIPPHKLIWSVESEEYEDARVFGHTERKKISELKSAGYDVKGLILEVKSSDAFKEKIAQMDDLSIYSENKLAEEEYADVAELYTKILNDQNIYEYHIVTMGNIENGEPQQINIQSNVFDTPFRPMGIFRPVDRLGKFYGFGMIEPSKGTLDAEEDTLNMSMEALWTDISRPLEYNPLNIYDINALEFRPRTLIPVKVLGQSVAPLNTPTLNSGAVQFALTYIQKSKQNISGVTDYQTGAEQAGGDKTAFEVNTKTQESNARLRFIIENFEDQVIIPIGKFALIMNKQFLADKDKIIYRVVGRKGQINEKKIKFKDIEAIKDISIVRGSTALMVMQEEFAKWKTILDQVYLEEKSLSPVPIDKEPIWENLLEKGAMIEDFERYLPNAKEREENDVQNSVAQLADAEEESDNPSIARVLPTDNHQVHLEIHQAVAKVGIKSTGQPLAPEEMQMLVQHINDHTMAMGGQVPQFAQGQAQMVNQQMQNMVQPNQPNKK